jgi:hypothetical protein
LALILGCGRRQVNEAELLVVVHAIFPAPTPMWHVIHLIIRLIEATRTLFRMADIGTKGRRAIPARNGVTSLSYGQEAHRRVGTMIALAILVSPIALFGLMHKTRLHYIGIQYTIPGDKKGGILLQGDKDNYRAILVALQGVTGVAVSVGEKDREFIPVSLRTEVTKGEEEKPANDKGTETTPTAGKPTETAPSEAAKGTVNVSANPAGADVLVDGAFVGNSPSALKLTPGKHTVTVKMSGYADWSKDITVQSGSEVQLTANLEKQSPQFF